MLTAYLCHHNAVTYSCAYAELQFADRRAAVGPAAVLW
ncbi:hypothetical protein QO019_002622 [Streptomyces thermodiastaticus]|uniref:Uncharacterized protein n=1 Tax=Streptomyces thermodiastaticus TaxID=44061 RepID=A0ABU0KIE8_9ACTN|nr:hypothetical protein [Streptomyces thermodiastaticus]